MVLLRTLGQFKLKSSHLESSNVILNIKLGEVKQFCWKGEEYKAESFLLCDSSLHISVLHEAKAAQ